MLNNYYKKLNKATNYFKKLESGASNYLKKMPSLESAVNSGLDYLKKNNVARKIGNTLEKAGTIARDIGTHTGNPIASQLGNMGITSGNYVKRFN
jgi:hypothetical protein